jgi:integrase
MGLAAVFLSWGRFRGSHSAGSPERGRKGGVERVVFAQYPSTGVDGARREARTLLGTDGDLARRKRRERSPTFGSAVEKYLQRRSVPGRFWKELGSRFENQIIPAIGKNTQLGGIRKADLDDLIETKRSTHPVAARTLYEALRPFFKWCVSLDLIDKSPLEGLPVPAAPESRDRTLSDQEVRIFWAATNMHPVFGPLYRLLLLTAQRREEVGAITWSELDLGAAVWVIPRERTKNGKAHLVHLSCQALEVIAQVHKIDGCPYLFSTTHTTPISGYGRAKAKLDEHMGDVPPWRVHDLRRTAASGMAKLGFQPHIVERVLNHVSGAQGGLVGVYQRYEYLEERKRAIEAWGQYVLDLTHEAVRTSNVVQMARGVSHEQR